MLDVFLTVDVEIWCGGWDDLDQKFPHAYQRYVYGRTPRGERGLPFQLRLLNDHGLIASFFVEPLFSARFGSEPLAEIVRLINDAGQEVQLHLHTEWVDEARKPLLPNISGKRQHLHMYSFEEQTRLISIGRKMLQAAGASAPTAFRAGSFAFNLDSLRALAINGIEFDTSYNAQFFGLGSGVSPGVLLCEPITVLQVYEYPMTVFWDGFGRLRHAQLGACSISELEHVLWHSLEARRSAVVILSHNFELLNGRKDAPDNVVVRRMMQLCRFLDKNRDSFRVRGFRDLRLQPQATHPAPVSCPMRHTARRIIEQAYRRIVH